MSFIQPHQGGGLSTWQASRAAHRINGRTGVDVALVEARQTIQEAQVDAMAAVTQRGMQGVAFISQVEQQLAQAVPLAATRLQGLADVGALGLGQIVMDTANKLRRL